MDLKDRLDAAMGTPPPTAMSPEALIAAGRAGERTRRRWQGATAGGVVALAGAAVALSPAQGPADGIASSASGVPSPSLCPAVDVSPGTRPRDQRRSQLLPTASPSGIVFDGAAARRALGPVLADLAPDAAADVRAYFVVVPPGTCRVGTAAPAFVTVFIPGWQRFGVEAGRNEGTAAQRADRVLRTGRRPFGTPVPAGPAERRRLPGGVEAVVYPRAAGAPYADADVFGPTGRDVAVSPGTDPSGVDTGASPSASTGDLRTPTTDEMLRVAAAVALIPG